MGDIIILSDSQSPVKHADRNNTNSEEDSDLEDLSCWIHNSSMDSNNKMENGEGVAAAKETAADDPCTADTSSLCMMECGCCFSDVNLEDMVQCGDGHLFCQDCLRRYAAEAIHGQGQSRLSCMTADCGSPFPRNQLQRALTEEMIKKLDERLQEESLNMANLEDLVRCPHCNYAAEIADPTVMVFVCQQCERRTCRKCKVNWDDHEGLKCEQVEKQDETTLRTRYEEKMTEARVRNCPKCKAPIVKESGCNKVTCRCGGVICYICREPNVDYNHFCQHVGVRGVCRVQQCTRCKLWTDTEEDERKIIEELKELGKMERQKQGFAGTKEIGVPEEQKKKKKGKAAKAPAVHLPPQIPHIPMHGAAYFPVFPPPVGFLAPVAPPMPAPPMPAFTMPAPPMPTLAYPVQGLHPPGYNHDFRRLANYNNNIAVRQPAETVIDLTRGQMMKPPHSEVIRRTTAPGTLPNLPFVPQGPIRTGPRARKRRDVEYTFGAAKRKASATTISDETSQATTTIGPSTTVTAKTGDNSSKPTDVAATIIIPKPTPSTTTSSTTANIAPSTPLNGLKENQDHVNLLAGAGRGGYVHDSIALVHKAELNMIKNRQKLTENMRKKHHRQLAELTERIKKEEQDLVRLFEAQQERINARKKELGMIQ